MALVGGICNSAFLYYQDLKSEIDKSTSPNWGKSPEKTGKDSPVGERLPKILTNIPQFGKVSQKFKQGFPNRGKLHRKFGRDSPIGDGNQNKINKVLLPHSLCRTFLELAFPETNRVFQHKWNTLFCMPANRQFYVIRCL